MSRLELIANANCEALLTEIDTFLFDCDGVLWNENAEAFSGAVSVVQKLRSMGKRIFFITNNSSKTRTEYAERCNKLGYDASEDDIICTAWLLAAYLKDVLNFSGKAYVVGGSAIQTECQNKGIDIIGPGVEDYKSGYAGFLETELDPDVNAVVVGFDPYINYMKTLKAASYLQRPGCLFVASNMDSCLPTSGPIRVPGTGSLVSFVSFAADKEPVVVGKPTTLSRDILQKTHGEFNPARTMMVGDRMNTDILFGSNCGFKTLLVLTGVNSLQDARSLQASNSINDQKCIPQYYIDGIGDLANYL